MRTPWGHSRRRRAGVVAVLAALLVPLASAAPAAARPDGRHGTAGGPTTAPRTVVLDGKDLVRAKARLRAGGPRARRALRDLAVQADAWLGQGPWTVVDKDRVPPSGDLHDYFSQAPYWWPGAPRTPDNPQGCPYVQRDGERNPEVDGLTDHDERGKVFESAYELSLAWYYTGRHAYAEHAARILRTWFVDPATRMNPNLGNAQAIPCRYDGRAIGIIDFSQGFTSLLDATAVLDLGAPGWSARDRDGMRTWENGFLDWLVDSDFGRQEGAAANNHGTFHHMQVAALAAATGRTALARRTVTAARAGLIDPQITADGSQPQELARTRSWHYSTFNLVAFTRSPPSATTWASTCGATRARAARHCGGPSTSCCRPPPVPGRGPTPSWTSTPTPPPTSSTPPPTTATGGRAPRSRTWRRPRAATCGRSGPHRSNWTASRAERGRPGPRFPPDAPSG